MLLLTLLLLLWSHEKDVAVSFILQVSPLSNFTYLQVMVSFSSLPSVYERSDPFFGDFFWMEGHSSPWNTGWHHSDRFLDSLHGSLFWFGIWCIVIIIVAVITPYHCCVTWSVAQSSVLFSHTYRLPVPEFHLPGLLKFESENRLGHEVEYGFGFR